MIRLEKQLILASKSPRRKELMQGLGLPFIIKTKEGQEDFPENMALAEVPVYLAKNKAMAFREELGEDDLIIAADTVVVHQGKILNKPKDKSEALQMLRALSGSFHQVITGVCLMDQSKTLCFDERTEVHFKELNEGELMHYIENYKPYDKAGAYGVQEWIGYVAVYRIVGSFYNVMGLPVHRIYEELKRW